MGNLVESSSFDPTVHQIETTDAVLGGAGAPINTSLQAVTNRTRYLLDTLTALLSSAAPIASPTFTGTVRAPTPAAGDSTTKIATTAYAQNLAKGIATVDVTGLGSSITLTAPQYGAKIILFTGTLAANTNVIFPNTGEWLADNQTSGAFQLTCKTAAGTGVAISQTKSLPIFCDGTNTVPALTDIIAVRRRMDWAVGAWTNGSTQSTAHAFGSITSPTAAAYATCSTTEGGYSVGDVINVTGQVSAAVGTTNLYVVIPAAGISAFNRSTQAAFTLTPAKWSLRVTADTM